MEKETIVFTCSVCSKNFTQKKNLYAHLRKLHKNEPQLSYKTKLECGFCHCKFTRKSSLTRHIKTLHKFSNPDHEYCVEASTTTRQSRILCPEKCEKCFSSNTQLRKHLCDTHGINIEFEELTFESIQEFENWKEKIQQETFSMYTLDTATKILCDGTKRYYNCHRSYKYKSKGKNKRAIKSMGSNKIDTVCPSRMEVLTANKNNKEGTILIRFWKTYCGHTADIGRITLDKNTRAEIAEKLKDGVTFEHILDSIRDSQSDKETLELLSLLERQDIHNIARDFNITYSTKRHKDDAVSIQLWVNEMETLKDSPVLFYKAQNELHDSLNKDDFILIIMTEFQIQQLLKFGHDKICLDGTHGTNAYDIQLYTLMIVDEFQNGCPVAYCFSNRGDEHVFRLLFDKIKSKVGIIEPTIFMTDDYPAFYNAWKYVMKNVPNRLLCTWHIDRNWRSNLNKIKGCEKQALVYKSLRFVLELTSINEFIPHLNNLLENLLSDEDTHSFGKYFQREYYNRPECWAYCYRLGLGINTNMYLESFHKILKHIYLQGKKVKRLDQSIDALMKLTRDSYFKRLIKLAKNHSADKVRDVNRSHRTSDTMKLNGVETIEEQKSWIVPSSSNSSQKYHINWIQETCSTSCLKCVTCNICIHTFKCSCTENVIKMNICKHIHYCAQNFFPLNNTQNVETTNNELINLHKLNQKSYKSVNNNQEIAKKMELIMSLSNRVSINGEEASLINKKLDNILDILNKKVDTQLEPVEHVNVKENIKQQNRLLLKRSSHKLNLKQNALGTLIEQEEETGEQNVSVFHKTFHNNGTQPRLFSTKKKIMKLNTLKKPSMHERNAIKVALSDPNKECINIHKNFDHFYCNNS